MNDPKLMTGPQDLWHLAGFEWSNGKYDKPVFIRSAYRRIMPSDKMEQLRDQVADKLDDFHPMDYKAVRVLYRAYKRFDEIAFGPRHEREVAWITGCFVTAIVCGIAILMKLRGLL